MKITSSLPVLAALCAPLVFAGAPAVLQPGTAIMLRLKQPLSSESAHVNDRVEFEVAEDVVSAGAKIIARGAAAWGRVADAAPAGRVLRNGRLAVDIESVAVVDGASVRLQAAGTGADARKPKGDGADSLGALPALPFTVFRYGKAVEIPAGKLVTVYTAEAVVLGGGARTPERTAPQLGPLPVSASVLPSLRPASEAVSVTPAAAMPAAVTPAATPVTSLAVAPANSEPLAVKHGYSKKLLLLVVVGAAAGVAGILAAKGHGGSPGTAAAASTSTSTSTSVGLGTITVGGPH